MTTAIALWLVGGGGLALYVGWAATAVAGGASPWWYAAGLPLLYLATLLAITLLWFALAWIFRAERPPRAADRIRGDRPPLLGRGARDRPVRPAHGALPLADARTRARARRAPRCCFCTACSATRARCAGCAATSWHAISGPCTRCRYGPPLASIDVFADQVAAKVDAILAATGAARVAIVGHSMGGLVARAYLRRYGSHKVSLVMTLGTPHHGSVHAWLFPGTSLAQLRPGNAWLAELNRGRRRARGRSPRVAVVMARLDGRAADELASGRAPRTSSWHGHRPSIAAASCGDRRASCALVAARNCAGRVGAACGGPAAVMLPVNPLRESGRTPSARA